jgi:hypothetical protein
LHYDDYFVKFSGLRNQPSQGWFGGDLLGSINDAIGIGGVTENIFKVVAKDLGNNSNHFQKNNKQGESLTGLHPKAITLTPTDCVNLACFSTNRTCQQPNH